MLSLWYSTSSHKVQGMKEEKGGEERRKEVRR